MMKSNSPLHRLPAGVGLLALFCIGPTAGLAQPKPKPPVPAPQNPRPAVDDFLNPASGPITLTKVLDFLRQIREDTQSEGRLLKAIDARGVEFPMTPSNVQKIQSAGGSTKLMELLQHKAPAPPPLPPPPAAEKKKEPNGVLTVRCDPAECEVIISSGPPINSRNGTATQSLAPGEAAVDIRKPGYLRQRHSVTIRAGSDNSISVSLEPDSNTQAEFGARLLKGMVDAAGGDAIHKDLATIVATGSATAFDAAGSGTEWNLTVTFRAGQSTFEAKNSAGGLKLDCHGETCQAQPLGSFLAKRLSKEQSQVLETDLRQLKTYHFAAVLERLGAGNLRPSSKTARVPGTGEQRLRLEGDTEAYNISLDAQLLPTFIAFESKTGLGSGATLGFTDYVSVGSSQYPRTTEIKLPDGKQGLRVRFDQLNTQAK